MGNYVIYKKPAVEDRYYDDYDWTVYKKSFDSREEAREYMPDISSEVGAGYLYKLIKFEDDDEIPSSMTDREIQRQKRKYR